MTTDFLVDSHCHLNYKGLVHDQDNVIHRARAAGVGTMLAINTKLHEFCEIVSIVEKYPDIYGTVGIHPHEALNENGVTAETLIEHARHPKIVGLGETGLDYFYENAPRAEQTANFKEHLRAGQVTGLPVIIHTRDADDDCASILKEAAKNTPFKAVIHCFTASREFAEVALSLGLYISISGIVTFKNAAELQEIVRDLPLDRLLVETDSPFLAPVPYRGRTCEPAFVVETTKFIADLKGISFDELRAVTTHNFFKLFDKAQIPKGFTGQDVQ